MSERDIRGVQMLSHLQRGEAAISQRLGALEWLGMPEAERARLMADEAISSFWRLKEVRAELLALLMKCPDLTRLSGSELGDLELLAIRRDNDRAARGEGHDVTVFRPGERITGEIELEVISIDPAQHSIQVLMHPDEFWASRGVPEGASATLVPAPTDCEKWIVNESWFQHWFALQVLPSGEKKFMHYR